MSASDLPLGRQVSYPREYDPSLLFPIARASGREDLGLHADALPFIGADRWHAYELGWLDARGKPVVATASITVPATSPRLIESKSLKLYLNSFNGTRFDGTGCDGMAVVRERIGRDLCSAAGAPVDIAFGLPPLDTRDDGDSLDALELDIAETAVPAPDLLRSDEATMVAERLHSALLKSNCPVTGQPDWASLRIDYRGPRIDRAALLRYLVSFRNHAGFHEQCVERIFVDLLARCRPQSLSMEARYTRRGGLDINPWRATPGLNAPPPGRDARQ